ncbi:Methylmalonyl-CoA mutase accessory protein [Candidatus Desulfarcum epimagneticum]|uniref:Methylmalonyl-CoA mutase accessory protein n=1 Tax=uncultured Desulfobacteraceae bacterium TaxID=218296 RepID=A0A484HQZ7_9BACT|nr:Methylmalonyl-CoA mutase accessory protein [uncultured Desulfobacteraceae bacterium]
MTDPLKKTDPAHYIEGVLNRDFRALSKAITLIESSRSDHRKISREIVDGLLPKTGKAVRVGITGVPGVGKSAFIESFGMMLVEEGRRVAVLSIDPSSVRSGGSIMADKTRMKRLSAEKKAYIRPSPSGGTLGGVARKTRETLLLCEAAGFDVIIVETVGVGQSETVAASMVDFFLLLMLAGAGDELQGIKKGVMEIADAIVINKADGDNIEKAEQARREYESAVHLLSRPSDTWNPPALTCSALAMTGVREVWETILSHRDILLESGGLMEKRRSQSLDWMWSIVDEGLKERFRGHPGVKDILPQIVKDVDSGRMAPAAAADSLLFALDRGR